MCKETQQRVISKCVFNGRSNKIKQNHISKVLHTHIHIYIYFLRCIFKFYLGFISSWLPEVFLRIQLTQNVLRLIASHALKDKILTPPHILDTLEFPKAVCNLKKLNASHERHFQHKIQALKTLEEPQNIPTRVNALHDHIYSKIILN